MPKRRLPPFPEKRAEPISLHAAAHVPRLIAPGTRSTRFTGLPLSSDPHRSDYRGDRRWLKPTSHEGHGEFPAEMANPRLMRRWP